MGLSQMPESVTYVSGILCYPSARTGINRLLSHLSTSQPLIFESRRLVDSDFPSRPPFRVTGLHVEPKSANEKGVRRECRLTIVRCAMRATLYSYVVDHDH